MAYDSIKLRDTCVHTLHVVDFVSGACWLGCVWQYFPLTYTGTIKLLLVLVHQFSLFLCL